MKEITTTIVIEKENGKVVKETETKVIKETVGTYPQYPYPQYPYFPSYPTVKPYTTQTSDKCKPIWVYDPNSCPTY